MPQDPSAAEFVRKVLRLHQRGIICFGEVFLQIVSQAGRAQQIVAELPADVVAGVKTYLEREPKSFQEWEMRDADWLANESRFYKGDRTSEDFRAWQQARAEERRKTTNAFRRNVEMLRAYLRSRD